MDLVLGRSEHELRDFDIRDGPCHPTVARRHLARDTLRFSHGLVVVRIRRVQRDRSVDPLMRRDGTAVFSGAFDRAAPS